MQEGKINTDILEEISMKAKIVTFDIESLANLLWSWQVWSQNWNAIEVELEWHVMCFAYKWFGKKTQFASIRDYKDYKPTVVRHKDGSFTINPPDEYGLMLEMRNILDEADIVVGWNSKRFDVKKVQAKMIALGITPPSPFKQIDVMQEKKKVASSNSNKLDDTGTEWGLGKKLPHEGWPLWKACAEGDPKAWKKMERYNIQDVNLTEKTYKHLLPWIQNHPNINVYEGTPEACPNPNCRKTDTLVPHGYSYTPTRARRRWMCAPNKGGCGRTSVGELVPVMPNRRILIK